MYKSIVRVGKNGHNGGERSSTVITGGCFSSLILKIQIRATFGMGLNFERVEVEESVLRNWALLTE